MAFAAKRIVSVIPRMRSIHTAPVAYQLTGLDKIDFQLSHYRKYGLLRDDILYDQSPVIKEAVSRLPEDVLMNRIYRSIRAHQLHVEHNVLPKEQWTTLEDDHEYLQPYINEVVAEMRERDEWERTH